MEVYDSGNGKRSEVSANDDVSLGKETPSFPRGGAHPSPGCVNVFESLDNLSFHSFLLADGGIDNVWQQLLLPHHVLGVRSNSDVA